MSEDKTHKRDMNDKPKAKKRGGRPKGGNRKQGYTSTSPAVCIVLYDLSGRPMPDKIAAEFVNIAGNLANKYGYAMNYTRQ